MMITYYLAMIFFIFLPSFLIVLSHNIFSTNTYLFNLIVQTCTIRSTTTKSGWQKSYVKTGHGFHWLLPKSRLEDTESTNWSVGTRHKHYFVWQLDLRIFVCILYIQLIMWSSCISIQGTDSNADLDIHSSRYLFKLHVFFF